MTIAAVPPLPTTGLSEEHARWLEDRAIPCEVAAEAGLRSRGHQLIFPYTLSGTELYAKIRGPGKKFWIEPSGVPLILWGLDALENVHSDTLIITEGEIDALSWMAAGAPAVVSVPNGAVGRVTEGDHVDPLDDKRFQYLWTIDGHLLPILEKFKRVVLSTDGDEPGVILGLELANRIGHSIGPERIWRLQYPEGCKDANEVLVKYGISGLGDLLDRAVPVTKPRLCRFSEIVEDNSPTYPIGMGLSENIIICPPELFVVTGAPGAGKSQFTLNMGANLARLYGQKGAILQLEDNPIRNRRDLERYARKWHADARLRTKSRDGKAEPDDGSPKIAGDPSKWVDDMFVTIAPYVSEEEPYTLEWLTKTLREAARTRDCKWVIIDPWNEIEHLWHTNETEVAYTNRALAQLKALARMLQITLFIVTHPSKGGGSKSDIRDMSLYDVSGSAAFKNKADHGVVLLRPGDSNRVYVKIDKSKDHVRMGQPGTVTMEFDRDSSIYRFIGRGALDEELS